MAAAPAAARDSLAPADAGHRWLPREQWVTHHWLPYDERRLLRILRVSRADLLAWLRDDTHHRIAQLVRARGLRVSGVAEVLVAPSLTRFAPSQYARLRERARRTLTQGHLAQHVFFHYLHQSEVMAHAWEIFGAAPGRFHRMRAVGYTPAEIGAVHGRSRASVMDSILRVCRLSAAAGVRDGETPARQAAQFLRHQRWRVRGYLDQVLHAPRRQRLGLPPAARGEEPSNRLLGTLIVAAGRAASVLPQGRSPNGPLAPRMPAVYDNFAVWPVPPFLALGERRSA